MAGTVGALGGSTLGKMLDGQKLLLIFALLMLVVGALMLRNRTGAGDFAVRLGRDNFPALLGLGLAAAPYRASSESAAPALTLATRMPILNAIGSSLVAVRAFGLTTAANYAFSGLVDWRLAIVSLQGAPLAACLARGWPNTSPAKGAH